MWLACNTQDGLAKTRLRWLTAAIWWSFSTFCTFWALAAVAAAIGHKGEGSFAHTFVIKLSVMIHNLDQSAPLIWTFSLIAGLVAGAIGANVAIRLRYLAIRNARPRRPSSGGQAVHSESD